MRTFDRQRGDKRASELQPGDRTFNGRVVAIWPCDSTRINVLIETDDGQRFMGSWKKNTTIRVRSA
jgi:hypothetical protein